MSTVTSRRFAEKDKEELNALYNWFTGRSRTIDQFDWEWLHTPEGQGSMWLLIENDTGRIIGHHGLIPIRFSFFGSSVLAGKTENTLIDPQYAGKGIYYPFEVDFFNQARKRFQLLYTTTAFGAPGRIRQKLGYAMVGHYITYTKFLRNSLPRELITRALKNRLHNKFFSLSIGHVLQALSVIPIILVRFFCKKVPVDRAIELKRITEIDAVAEELDRFWELNKRKFGITADRNSKYLKWKIFDNPNLAYDFFLATKQGELVGYAITKRTREGQGAVVDLIASDNNEIIFNTILGRVVSKFREDGINIAQFQTLFSNNFLNRVLRRNGFVSLFTILKAVRRIPREESSPLMAKALNDNLASEKVANPANWYFTDILFEGVQ